ncbi:MAG: hypothetical protein HYY13_05560 [Nitrospirae bacterium]|nr:hypothetical protein [Nitrospirota bacterium]
MRGFVSACVPAGAALFVYTVHLFPIAFLLSAPLLDSGAIFFLPLLFLPAPLILRPLRRLQARPVLRFLYYATITAFQAGVIVRGPRPVTMTVLAATAAFAWVIAQPRYPRAALAALWGATFVTIWHAYYDMATLLAMLCIPFWLGLFATRRREPRPVSDAALVFFALSWVLATGTLWSSTYATSDVRNRVLDQPGVRPVVLFNMPRPAGIVNTNAIRYVREACNGKELLAASRNGIQGVPSLVRFDPASLRTTAVLESGGAGDSFRVDCEAGVVILPDIHGHRFLILDEKTLSVMREIPARRPLHALGIEGTPGVILVDEAGAVGILEPLDGPVRWVDTDGERIKGAAVAPPGRYWLTTGTPMRADFSQALRECCDLRPLGRLLAAKYRERLNGQTGPLANLRAATWVVSTSLREGSLRLERKIRRLDLSDLTSKLRQRHDDRGTRLLRGAMDATPPEEVAPLDNDMFVLLEACPATGLLLEVHMVHGRVDVRRTDDLSLVHSIPSERGVRFARCAPDGRTAYVLNHFTGDLLRLDLATGIATSALNLGSRGHQITLSNDGRSLYVVTSVGILRLELDTLDAPARPTTKQP